jgi:hypothetical protein
MPEHRIDTAIEIAAPAERVWEVLIDFASYPAWNPFLRRIEGSAKPGSKLRVYYEPPGKPRMSFRPTIVELVRQRELRWRTSLVMSSLLEVEHAFHLEDKGRTCKLHHTERFSGLLLPLFGTELFEMARTGFEAMNAALRSRSEMMATGK